jgi:probable F420-dependent oxidoreductase
LQWTKRPLKTPAEETTMRFGVMTDFRNPPDSGRSSTAVYADILDHMVWAESIGFDDAVILEHHFTDDGYIPSPLIAAAAVAARTKRMRVMTNIVILPLYDPVRIAEDAAVLDVISNGRLDLGVGMGYRPEEFAGYGIDIKTRGARADEMLQIIRRLWHGERVTFHGKHFNIEGAKLTPLPVQKPNPPIWVGGFSKYAMRRAARYGDGYTAGGMSRAIYEQYLAELRKADKDASQARVTGGSLWLVVGDDPERTFAKVAPHVLYWYNAYAKFFETTEMKLWPIMQSTDELKTRKLLTVLTPDDAVKLIKEQIGEIPVESYSVPISPPGMPADQFRSHLELFAQKVIPHFR